MTVCGDVAVEANETFNVNLSNASDSATITDPTGVGTIENDDVSFSIDDVQQLEGQSGTTSFVFTVTKTGTVRWPGRHPYDRLRDQQRDRDRRPDLPGRRLRVRPAAA